MGTGAFTAACIQVNALNDMAANIAEAERLIRLAKGQGADMVFMPENVVMMEWGKANILAKAYGEEDHPALARFRVLAQELDLWLHCGTLAIRVDGGDRVANRTYVINPAGEVVASYDKIHMFDVDLDNGESYRESATFRPGESMAVVDLPWGRLGLAVCYDIRFPYLFRAMAKAGADFLTIPAAFTKVTGEAHWHILQRARAIETGCYVISPAQTGTHINDRKTYGHALIVDPWGEVLADAGTEPGLIMARIDAAKVAEVRGKVPSLQHDRPVC